MLPVHLQNLGIAILNTCERLPLYMTFTILPHKNTSSLLNSSLYRFVIKSVIFSGGPFKLFGIILVIVHSADDPFSLLLQFSLSTFGRQMTLKLFELHIENILVIVRI